MIAMKRLLLISILVLVAGCGGEKAPQMNAGHVIFVGVDGVSTPAFKDPALLARMPNVKMMMEEGSYTLGKRSVMPSLLKQVDVTQPVASAPAI